MENLNCEGGSAMGLAYSLLSLTEGGGGARNRSWLLAKMGILAGKG